jgi:hypothetical protein
MISDEAIKQATESMSTEALKPENFETMMDSIVSSGEQYGADWASSIIAGIANGSQKFDFSSIYGELSESEVSEINDMTA